MDDLLGADVGFEVFLRHVGRVLTAVHEDVVPGLVSIRLGLVPQVPGIVRATGGIAPRHYATVAIAKVLNQLTDLEIDTAILQAEERIERPAKHNAIVSERPQRRRKPTGRRYEPSPQLRLSFD